MRKNESRPDGHILITQGRVLRGIVPGVSIGPAGGDDWEVSACHDDRTEIVRWITLLPNPDWQILGQINQREDGVWTVDARWRHD